MSYAINVPQASIGQATTCLTCAIRLPSLETQQLHHKSDWHTYNLKRKMVGLPPVSSEVFSQLVTASREQANPEEVPQPECVPCGKKYLSFQAYDNHINSKKHKQLALAYEKKQQQKESSRPTEVDLASAENAPPTKTTTLIKEPVEQLEPSETVCLFCSHKATDAVTNYDHMRTIHGFFLPSVERLIDLPGMLAYLADKLVQDHDCLWCTPSVFSQNLRPDQELHAGFATLGGVRRHMIDKGHCKLAMEQGAEREYADFYLPVDIFDDEYDEDDENALEDQLEGSSMTADDLLDEDERRLNEVLLDEDGNWILDSQSSNTSGIRVDPVTNELVLNHRRLAHKDAARRQRIESRAVTLTSRSQRRPSTTDASTTEADGEAVEGETDEKGVSISNDRHRPGLRVSKALLKSQNQLSGSTVALSSGQLSTVARKVAKAQNFEAISRQRMTAKLQSNANFTGRLRVDSPFGLKV
ncbi:hypothetical protein BGX28_000476 [Mortierella sp. GBA30]|nr:hypothetical protein BGX28_000476 [Mortierella sp. GBA30]